jgi:hypothetical protein
MGAHSRLEGVLRAVKRDHERLVALLASLVSQADPVVRWEIFDDLRRTLDAHTRAERLALFPLFDGDHRLPSAAKADDAHREIDAIVDELAATRPFAATWYELSNQLRQQVEAHFASEEGALFEAGHALLPANALRQVGNRLVDRRNDLTPNAGALIGLR